MSEWFLQPWALFGLVAAPLVWGWLSARERGRSRRMALLCGRRAQVLTRGVAPRRRRVSRWLAAAGLACLALTFAQPMVGDDRGRIDTKGADIVICLDVSRSMLARDLEPDRLRAARREIHALTERTHNDRFALIVFAGEARVSVPLTGDVAAFLELVDRADPLAVARGGTDLGAALDLAARSLEARSDRYGTVLLLTDGEDLEARGLAAAERCAKAGVTVHCVGFGTERGSRIAIDDGSGTEHYLRDASGREVVSALAPSSLRRIAEATGGVFVAAVARPLPLSDLYQRRILPAARAATDDPSASERANRFQWPLALGVLLLLLEAVFNLAAQRARPGLRGRDWAPG